MRIALRSLSTDRGSSALAVLSLAAGLGLTAALASVADALLFRPFPIGNPAEIVRVFTSSAAQPLGFVSYYDFFDLRRASRLTSIVGQTQILLAAAPDSETPAQIRLALGVTTDYFDILRVAPALGRAFRNQDARANVVVLAHAYWETQYASDPRAIGRTIRLGSAPFTIIGVAPKNFSLDRFTHESLYVPIDLYAVGRAAGDRSWRCMSVYARLHSGVQIEAARSEIAAIADRLAAQYPATNRGQRAAVMTDFEARLRSDSSTPALARLLTAVAALILAIACANAAGLLLARAENRATDIAIRMALGARHLRVLADCLIESTMLAVAGAALGLPLAWAAVRLLSRTATLPTDFPFAIEARTDARVFAVTMCATIAAALAAGVAPAIAAFQCDIAAALKSRAASPKAKWRNILMIAEVALATALAGCAGLLLAAIHSAARADPGFRAAHVLTLALDRNENHFYQRLLDRMRPLPGVKSAALAQSAPLGYTRAQRQIEIEGQPEAAMVWMNIVSDDYFEALHIPLVSGRAFDRRDTASAAPVAIVNEELAKLGTHIRMNGRPLNVIGVARTAKYFSLGEPRRPFFYLPLSQNQVSRMVLLIETTGDPAAFARAALDAIRSLDSAETVSEIRPLNDYILKGATFHAHVALDAVGAVCVCGLVLALAGLYGVVSRAVNTRKREIGIRLALGSERGKVVASVLARGIRLALIGSAAGVVISLAAGRSIAKLLPGATFSSALPLSIGAGLVTVFNIAACLIPACRAANVDPTVALRCD